MRYLILSAVILFGASVASAATADAPKRKSGLWEMKMSSSHHSGQMITQCVDQKSDDIMQNKMHEEKMSCTKREVRREGDKIVAESVCKMDGTTATTRAVFTGKFDSAYKADIKNSYDPPMHGMRESAMTIDARWVGPCLPGQKPGDIMMPGMPGGMPNMEEMMKKQKGQ